MSETFKFLPPGKRISTTTEQLDENSIKVTTTYDEGTIFTAVMEQDGTINFSINKKYKINSNNEIEIIKD